MLNRKSIFLILVIFGAVCISLIVSGVFFFVLKNFLVQSSTTKNIQYARDNSVHGVLLKNNPSFALAEKLSAQSLGQATDTTAIVNAYTQALQTAEDSMQGAHIHYRIGVAYMRSGQYEKAISILKDVAASTTASKYDRAYSVLELGNARYTYNDPVIDMLLFSDVPYSTMFVKGDLPISYRHVYEYASSFYPISDAEANIARWYARDALRQYQASAAHATNTPEIQNDFTAAQDYVIRASKGLQELPGSTSTPNAAVPPVLFHLAVVESALAQTTLESPKNAEEAFLRARDSLTQLYGKPSLFWDLHYALFLNAMYGTAREQDIMRTLSPLYEGDYPKKNPVSMYLTNERNNYLNMKDQIASLARVDQKFKAFLISLGWQESDFKKI